jgi:hypothetical protein
MRTLRLLTTISLVIVFAVNSLGQLTIDTTGPIRQRKREAVRGHVGSSGRKLSLQLAIQTAGSPPDEKGKTLVEFILTNSGKNELTLPVSPNAGDLEPSDPKTAYTVMRLGIGISLSKKPAVILPGGADLYGSAESPGTVIDLAPGDTIRVLARVALPEAGGPNPEGFDAIASLDNQTIRTVNGEVVSDSQDLGFARSPEYTLQSLSNHPASN